MGNGNFSRREASLVLLSGMPGAGKTTFVRALADRVPCEHVESDAVRRGIAPRPTYSGEESGRVFGIVERKAGEGLKAGRTVVVDATNLRRADRKRFLRLAARHDATVIGVRVTAPETVIRERLGRPREGFSQADTAVYEMMLGRAQRFDGAELVVDTRYPIGPSVELLVGLLRGPE
ncbi:MAG TPA: ATP-binding protein [Tepidiformaceae bacterium]|nr:ATP-binding protein [Tepidiformaceae bacterium]